MHLIYKSTIPLILLLALILGGCQSLHQNQWDLVKQQDDLEVYLRAKAGSKIPEFKGVTTVRGTPQQLLEILMDADTYPQWVYQCRQAKVINIVGYDQMYLYQVNSLPLVRDRDIILHGKIETNAGPGVVRVRMNSVPDYCVSSEKSACTAVNQSKLVRVTQSVGFFEARQVGPNELVVTWQQHLDPGGYLPAWLVKSQLSKLVSETLNGLKDQFATRFPNQ